MVVAEGPAHFLRLGGARPSRFRDSQGFPLCARPSDGRGRDRTILQGDPSRVARPRGATRFPPPPPSGVSLGGVWGLAWSPVRRG